MSESIEQLLKRQPLHPPGADLDRRVLAALAEPVKARTANPWKLALLPLGLAAAAAIAMAVTLNLPQGGTTQPVEVAIQTVSSESEPIIEFSQSWTQSEPLGVLLVGEHGGALRAIRQQQVQQTRWIDPADGVAIEITAPIAEAQLVLQPANVY